MVVDKSEQIKSRHSQFLSQRLKCLESSCKMNLHL